MPFQRARPKINDRVRSYALMCLAVPLKIIELNGKEAVGESMGLRRRMRVDFIDRPRIGDYVIVHAGFAIERLSERQALEDISAWEDVQNAL